MRLHGKNSALALVAIAMLGGAGAAQADYLGRGVWVPGQLAPFAGMQENSGWTVTVQPYYYSGDVKAKEYIGWDASVDARYDTKTFDTQVAVGYAFKDLVAGGRVNLGLLWGGGNVSSGLSASVNTPVWNESATYSDSSSGVNDVQPYMDIAWRSGENNYKLYVLGNIPTGSFDRRKLSNNTLGFYAVDFGGGYTYLDRKTGTEASLVLGATYNWENDTNQYQNGWNGHLDFSVSRFVTPQWSLGGVGYGYWQYTEDRFQGADNGARSMVFGLGPQATYVFKVNQREWTLNLRGYWEFGAENRPEGYSVFATLSMPLGN